MDKLRITAGEKLLFQEKKPDRVELIAEYPYFYLCEALYHHPDRDDRYRFCLNKMSILCGDVGAVNLRTGMALGGAAV